MASWGVVVEEKGGRGMVTCRISKVRIVGGQRKIGLKNWDILIAATSSYPGPTIPTDFEAWMTGRARNAPNR